MPDLFNGKSRSRSASSVRQARSQESVPSAPQPTSRFQMGALLSGVWCPRSIRSAVLATLPLNVLDGSLYAAVQQETAARLFRRFLPSLRPPSGGLFYGRSQRWNRKTPTGVVGAEAACSLRHARLSEPHRDCRRLYLLRGWSHDEEGIDEIRT